jgi:hypothetical protein
MRSLMALPGKGAYRKATEEARAAEHRLRLDSLKRLDRGLLEYANKLSKQVAMLPKTTQTAAQRAALLAAATNVRVARDDLIRTMEAAIGESRDVAFEEIKEIQDDATRRMLDAEGVDKELLARINTPNLTMAGMWESLGKGAATWRTLLRGYVVDAATDAQHVITSALIEGMGPDELAKRLRPYVLGAEPFQKAFADSGQLTDKMLRNPQFTKAANKLRYNADRIAMSEIHNARGEAELESFAKDPFVKAVKWQLSPNRGTLRKRDACDGLSKTDFYGMGPGIYPIAQVPLFPHPFCRCERIPVMRGIDEMHDPKPNPPRLANVVIKGTGCD